MKNIFIRAIYLAVFVFFFYSCATVVSPGGGPKDEDPPNLVASVPLNNGVNFQEDKLTFIFDEAIKVDKITKQLQINPYKDRRIYRYKTRNNKLILEFNEPLEDSTTFNFNFRNAVIDVTEGNPSENAIVAFSTGPELDTIQISGTVLNLMDNKPLENAVISLYDAKVDTAVIDSVAPYYYANTDEDGRFSISNIKSGEYRAYGLYEGKDGGNLKYDQREEKIQFFNKTFDINKDSANVVFKLIEYDNDTIIYERVKKEKGKTFLDFNKGLIEYGIEILDENYKDSLFHKLTAEGELQLFYTGQDDMPEDSLDIKLFAVDSLLQKLDTTAKLFLTSDIKEKRVAEEKKNSGIGGLFRGKEDETEKRGPTFKFTQREPLQNDLRPTEKFDLVLDFEKPVLNYTADSVWAIYGEDTLVLDKAPEVNFNFSQYTYSGFVADSAFALVFNPGAFISVFGDSSETETIKFSIKDETKFGAIEGQAKSKDKLPFFVQLLDSKFEVVDEIENEEYFRFEYVKPGDYFIRILVDENKDGEWSKGSYKDKIPPEPVIIFKKKITVKANWEIMRSDTVIEF
ncbi:Ig-like domain-containing domain [Sediminitomix flava]|uniref:Ig-like domain-containing protein n=1 Tax=Sediminitomix flava TaxID=379075 RepID=A0A315Z0F7_SEDFL|nr:Ig-like domain-containing domain [Sediminitomix flava]PWJ36032.1 Ig-like domain-containing protein [Sediminitomix flava]